jgi:hypothetical protein
MEVKLWNIPFSEYSTIKEAFECDNFLFLIFKWNQYRVTDEQICSSCPSSIDLVQKYVPKYLQAFENE